MPLQRVWTRKCAPECMTKLRSISTWSGSISSIPRPRPGRRFSKAAALFLDTEGHSSMDFGFSPEQDMLRQTARAFLEDNCPTSLVRQLMEDERGYKPELWKDMAELGWLGLAFPEEYGGQGVGFLGPTGIFEEMGAVFLPAPL